MCKSCYKRTVLFFIGFSSIAELLIQNGADAVGGYGTTALRWAVDRSKKKNSNALVHLLLTYNFQ